MFGLLSSAVFILHISTVQQNLTLKILQFKCVTAKHSTLSILIFYLITHASLSLEKLKPRYTLVSLKDDLMLMHEWIRENTPVTTKILSFPDDDSFFM